MQDTSRKTITLVLGGARSGKSRYLQALAARFPPVAFVATARPSDEEMRLKIERHQADRPQDWKTIEEPLHLDEVLNEEGAKYKFLAVDCLTLYAANLLEAEQENPTAIEQHLQGFYAALRTAACSVALVSNEVGSGIVPAFPLGRKYRDLLGEINQRVASIADNVLLMVAGLPLPLKGVVEVRAAEVHPEEVRP
jgi:adenosylcobinamide kinase/adenosylcobinamide-phosphate guanylyltransferase